MDPLPRFLLSPDGGAVGSPAGRPPRCLSDRRSGHSERTSGPTRRAIGRATHLPTHRPRAMLSWCVDAASLADGRGDACVARFGAVPTGASGATDHEPESPTGRTRQSGVSLAPASSAVASPRTRRRRRAACRVLSPEWDRGSALTLVVALLDKSRRWRARPGCGAPGFRMPETIREVGPEAPAADGPIWSSLDAPVMSEPTASARLATSLAQLGLDHGAVAVTQAFPRKPVRPIPAATTERSAQEAQSMRAGIAPHPAAAGRRTGKRRLPDTPRGRLPAPRVRMPSC